VIGVFLPFYCNPWEERTVSFGHARERGMGPEVSYVPCTGRVASNVSHVRYINKNHQILDRFTKKLQCNTVQDNADTKVHVS